MLRLLVLLLTAKLSDAFKSSFQQKNGMQTIRNQKFGWRSSFPEKDNHENNASDHNDSTKEKYDRIPLSGKNLGEFDPSEKLPGRKSEVLVGDPQIKVQKEISVSAILKELAAIQQQGPQKYCVLGTRHCSFLHQQIIELL